jgi:hypothetical protein
LRFFVLLFKKSSISYLSLPTCDVTPAGSTTITYNMLSTKSPSVIHTRDRTSKHNIPGHITSY